MFFATLVALFTLSNRALAESSVLLVVQGAPDQDPAPFELRLRSELAAEGLEVVTASGRSQQNLLDLEGLARRTGAVAGLSVLVDVGEVQGRLWVSDPNSNFDLVRTLRVTRTEGDAVSVFALRAVEALRGARLELEQQRSRASGAVAGATGAPAAAPALDAIAAPAASATAAAPSVTVPPKTNPNPQPAPKPPSAVFKAPAAPKPAKILPKPPPSLPMPWTILAGAVLGYDHNGLGTIEAPAVDARYQLWQRLALGLAFDGPFISPRRVAAGLVRVDQELV